MVASKKRKAQLAIPTKNNNTNKNNDYATVLLFKEYNYKLDIPKKSQICGICK